MFYRSLSGSDISAICLNAAMEPILRLGNYTHFKYNYNKQRQKWMYTPCSPGDENAVAMKISEIPGPSLNLPDIKIV